MSNNINQGAMLPVGCILRGIYRIESYLSSGGFGNTYIAQNVEFEETVAIKEFFMRGVSQRDANNTTVSVSNSDNKNLFSEQLQKFKKEARRLRKLKNSHIVAVHDLFEENGTAYYVMDYIDGENLSTRLKRLQRPLSESEVMGYLPQILDALECVHQEGLWHLDLKPANIMVDRKGHISLIDFGASKQRSSKGGATTSTAVSYTNGFAPREQMEQNLEKFGPWTDLYALGATLYNLLANRKPPLPSDIDDDRTSDKHLALPMPADISQKTRSMILKLLTTDRLDRPQSVEVVMDMLGSVAPKAEPVDDDVIDVPEEEETLVAGEVMHKDIPSDAPQKNEKPIPPLEKDTGEPIYEPDEPSLWEKIRLPLIAVCVVAVVVGAVKIFGGGEKEKPLDAKETIAEAQNLLTPKKVTGMQYTNSLGKFSYTGEVDADNVPNGLGEAVFENGNTYKGSFKNGNLDGNDAVFQYKNGDSFKGSFSNNAFENGRYNIAESGDYFVGTFKNGDPYEGDWYDKNNKVTEHLNAK